MAHSFGSTILARTSAATSPITRSATTSAGDTVLVLMLNVGGATNRAGGAPTFNGVAGIQDNSTQKAATSPEASAELWYWVGGIPTGTTGGLFIGTADIVIPNTGSLTIFSSAYTGQAATGFTSLFDAANGSNGTSANPTTNAIVSTVNGAIYFATVATGAQTWSPSGRTGTQLYDTDDGSTGGGGQYLLQTTAGSQAMSWTFGTSDDWGAVGVAFKEAPMPSPGAGGLTITGLTSVLAFGMAIGAGALSLTGQAPTVSVAGNPNDKVIQIPAGSLQFKGPALPAEVRTPAAGVLSFTGYAPNLAFTLPVPAGSVSLTGASLTLARTVPIASGGLTITGQGPSLGSGIPVGAGALTLTGQTPATSSAISIAVGSGALAIAGQAPTVGIGLTIPIPAGQLVFKGPAAPTSSTIAVPAGALALSGLVPSANVSGGALSVPIAAGTLSLSGQAPSVAQGPTIAIPAGSLTFTGQYIAQAFGDLTPAALVLTGYAPTVSISGQTTLSPGVGMLTLTGQAPSLASTVPVAAGALTLSGQAPVAIVSRTIAVPAGSLAFTGQAPQARMAHLVSIGAGSLALTGQTPSTGGSQTMPVAAGALTITGYSPSLSAGFVTNIPSGTLTITGQAPLARMAVVIDIPTGTLTLTGRPLIATAVTGVTVTVSDAAVTVVTAFDEAVTVVTASDELLEI